jgi:hypothetical protein
MPATASAGSSSMPSTTSPPTTTHEFDRVTPFDTCPRCGDHRFHVEPTDDGAAFRCLGCAARWQYELGYLRLLV